MKLESALQFSPNDLAIHLTRCFEGYVFPIAFTPSTVAALLRTDSIDLERTVVAFEEDELIGIAAVCRRQGITRIGGMGVVKERRSQGIGHAMVGKVIDDMRSAHEHHLMVEVFEHNHRARHFYQRLGFEEKHRLIGGQAVYTGEHPISRELTLDYDRLAMALAARGPVAFSWEHSPASALQYTNATRVMECDGLFLAAHPLTETMVLIRVIALSGESDVKKLNSALGSLGLAYPGAVLQIPPYFPEPEFGPIFSDLRFTPAPVAQIQLFLSVPNP